MKTLLKQFLIPASLLVGLTCWTRETAANALKKNDLILLYKFSAKRPSDEDPATIPLKPGSGPGSDCIDKPSGTIEAVCLPLNTKATEDKKTPYAETTRFFEDILRQHNPDKKPNGNWDLAADLKTGSGSGFIEKPSGAIEAASERRADVGQMSEECPYQKIIIQLFKDHPGFSEYAIDHKMRFILGGLAAQGWYEEAFPIDDISDLSTIIKECKTTKKRFWFDPLMIPKSTYATQIAVDIKNAVNALKEIEKTTRDKKLIE
jgi:hypothetical protein